MNDGDYLWLDKLKKKYPNNFKNCKVLELGSRNINGTVRGHFENCEFVGIDWVNGKDVDIVCLAHKTDFRKDYFDTLISFSTFEHDPYWRDSIAHNLPFLKKGAMIFFHWGGIGNTPHGCDYAADLEEYKPLGGDTPEYQELRNQGHFFPKSKREMVGYLRSLGCQVIYSLTMRRESSGVIVNLIAQK